MPAATGVNNKVKSTNAMDAKDRKGKTDNNNYRKTGYPGKHGMPSDTGTNDKVKSINAKAAKIREGKAKNIKDQIDGGVKCR